jgi:hypothetical protein
MFNIRTQAACAGPGSDLVSISAFCAFDSMYPSCIIPISTHSRIGGAGLQYPLFSGVKTASE